MSTKHYTPNDTMDLLNKFASMVQVEKDVVDLNEQGNRYVKNLVTNHISCSILGNEAWVPFTTTKHNAGKLLCMYIQVLFCSLVFLWGCFVGYVNFHNSFKDLIGQLWTWCSRTYLICANFKFNPWKTTQQNKFFRSCPR